TGAARWRPLAPGVPPAAAPCGAEAPPGPVVRHTKRLQEPSSRGILQPTRSRRDRSRGSSTGSRSSRPHTADPGLLAAHQSFAPYFVISPIYLASGPPSGSLQYTASRPHYYRPVPPRPPKALPHGPTRPESGALRLRRVVRDPKPA